MARRPPVCARALRAHQDGLALVPPPHLVVRRVRDGVHVRRQLAQGAAAVQVHHVGAVQVAQLLERVHRDQDGPRVRVDVVHGVPRPQVVQHARLVEVGQRRHVLRAEAEGRRSVGDGRGRGGEGRPDAAS